jgi:hypothetical protein
MTSPTALQVPDHVHWRRFNDEVVIVDLKHGEYYGLNEVAAAVFEHLAGGQSPSDVVGSLLEEYDVARADLERDVGRLLEELIGKGFLETIVVGSAIA